MSIIIFKVRQDNDKIHWGNHFFRRALMELYQRYQLPVMITENGMGTADTIAEDGCVHDTYRIEYLENHINKMKKAVMDGVPVIAYNTWTFIDVVSGSNGFTKRYGLVYVDRDELDERELKRVKKDSFYFKINIPHLCYDE